MTLVQVRIRAIVEDRITLLIPRRAGPRAAGREDVGCRWEVEVKAELGRELLPDMLPVGLGLRIEI